MESYYSRDDQVAWGILTPKEIQEDFQGTTRKPSHRHTDFGHYVSAPSEIKSNQDEQLQLQIPDVSGASAYFTPDESLQVETADKNSLFLEKLSKVIEDKNDVESTGYETALDNSNVLKLPQINNTLTSICRESSNNCTQLDKISVTLVENTVYLSSDDESVDENNSTDFNSVDTSDLIVISDDSFNSSLSQLSNLERNVKMEKYSNSVAKNFSKLNISNRSNQSIKSAEIDKIKYLPILKQDQDSYSSHESLLSRQDQESNSSQEAEFPSNNQSLNNHHESLLLRHEEENNLSQLNSHHESLSLRWNQESDSSQKVEFLSNNRSLNCHHESLLSREEQESSSSQDAEIVASNNQSLGSFNPNLLRRSDKVCNTILHDQSSSVKSHQERNSSVHEELDNASGNLPAIVTSSTHIQDEILENSVCEAEFDTYDFDDTLKEMEMAMKYGLDYVMPGDSPKKSSDLNSKTPHNFQHKESKSKSQFNQFDHVHREILENSASETEFDAYDFNDSVEEMEMASKYGLDYVMPGDSLKKSSDLDSSGISNDFVETPHNFQNRGNQLKSQFSQFDYVRSPVGDYIRKTPNTAIFKLPTKPIRSKQTPHPKSPRIINKHFQNIVSPVGVYIKNSPGVVLKQNVPVKELSCMKLFKTDHTATTSNKENIVCDFPEVIYKPAKKTVTCVQKEATLPSSIQQLIPTPSKITKHVKRIKETNLSETAVSRKLLEGDLTSASIDSSLLDSTNTDVSFLLTKQDFIK